MKTLSKIVLSLALGLLVLGLALGLVAFMMGGSPGAVGENLSQSRFLNFSGINSRRNNSEVASIFANQGDVINVYDLASLDFRIGFGEATIILGERFEVIYANEASREHFYHHRSGDTWHIGSQEVRLRGLWGQSRDDLRLTIVIPADFVADSAYIAVGAGVLRADMLSAIDLELSIGVGSATIEAVSAERLRADVGVGELRINNCDVSSINLDVGLGAIEIALTRDVQDYTGQISGGLGNIQIGTSRFAGIFDSSFGSSDAPYRLKVQVGLGSVTIR